MNHEKEVLVQLTELRQKVLVENLNTNEKVELDNRINTALQNVFARFENYPQLKASENFLKLQGAINERKNSLPLQDGFIMRRLMIIIMALKCFPPA
jgi:LemA protein